MKRHLRNLEVPAFLQEAAANVAAGCEAGVESEKRAEAYRNRTMLRFSGSFSKIDGAFTSVTRGLRSFEKKRAGVPAAGQVPSIL